MLKEASTITDLHNNADATEVELVSLISEKIPKYQLRANSIFGYNQQDWLQTPVLSPSTNVELSPELCEETFKYFILSGDRLSQMTRTYHDIEAVTHLLEEKERDLELAARIGQTLLQKNREFAQRNEQLEEQLGNALEEASQLRHEISLKEDLLNIYADDDTDSSGAPSPVKELRNYGRSGMYSHIEGLQARIRNLESENAQLKAERVELQEKSDGLEEEEEQLVTDTVKELKSLQQELKDANDNIHFLSEELAQRNEESIRQQEEITRLLTQIVDMQRKQKQLALENEELQQHLTAANNTQYELTREVQALEDRYQEVTHMLDETREEARLLRDYPEQFGRSVPFGDSLAAELGCGGEMPHDFAIQGSFYNPLSASIQWSSPPSSVVGEEEETSPQPLHAGEKITSNRITQSEPRPCSKRSESFSQRVLNTAKFVNSVKNHSMNSRFTHLTPRKQDRPIPTPLAIPGSNRSPLFVHASPDSTPSSGLATPSLGRPGVPGTEDLERAIRKLALRREGARYMEMEKRLAMRDSGSFSSFCDSGGTITPRSSMPSGGQTPPPSRPTTPRLGSRFRLTSQSYQAPKLRIVKPLEGSVTLNQWKYLAERDRLHTALQPNADMPSGVITRERAAEALTRSREASINDSSSDGNVHNAVPQIPVRQSTKSSIGNVSTDSLNHATLHPLPVPSSAVLAQQGSSGATEGAGKKKDANPTKKVLYNIFNPWNNFVSTATRHTYTDCRVMNPNDDNKNTTPTCSNMKVMATCCNNSLSTHVTMTTSHGMSSGSTGSYLSNIHPFLTGQPRKLTVEEQTAQAGKFFKDSTRTCSTELGLAHLFKEHAVKGANLQGTSIDAPTVVACSESSEEKASRPKTIGSDLGSAFTKKIASGQTASGHIVWNRSLQRTFLLPTLPTAGNILFNLNSRSSCKNPETPPNSPLTSAPSSSSYLLNEILSEPSPMELEAEKKEEGVFSSNLLSKIAQIGLMGLQGFRTTSKSTDSKTAVCSKPVVSYSSSSNTATTVVSSQVTLAKSATAPGSLLGNSRDPLPFASTPVNRLSVGPRNRSRLSLGETSQGDSKDEFLEMKPTKMDWADLHGSSGALNAPSGQRSEDAGSDYDDADGYPFEMSESPLREGKPPGYSSTPKGEESEGSSLASPDRRPRGVGTARASRQLSTAAPLSVRPKTLHRKKK